MIDLLDGARKSIAVVADKAFNLNAIRQHIADQSALAVIPTKSNAKTSIPHDKALYCMCNIVERFFCTMKDMKRLTTRYEKLSSNFMAMAHISAIRLLANCFQTLVNVTAPIENSGMRGARSDFYLNFGGLLTMLTSIFMTTARGIGYYRRCFNHRRIDHDQHADWKVDWPGEPVGRAMECLWQFFTTFRPIGCGFRKPEQARSSVKLS